MQAVHSILLNGFDARKSLSNLKHIWFAAGASYSELYSVRSAGRDSGAHRNALLVQLMLFLFQRILLAAKHNKVLLKFAVTAIALLPLHSGGFLES